VVVHLLTPKIVSKRGQNTSKLVREGQTDIYAKTPEIRGFPVFCKWNNWKYGSD